MLRGIVSAGRVGYIGEGGSGAGAGQPDSASPMTISLVTFLFGHKKVTYNIFQQKLWNVEIKPVKNSERKSYPPFLWKTFSFPTFACG